MGAHSGILPGVTAYQRITLTAAALAAAATLAACGDEAATTGSTAGTTVAASTAASTAPSGTTTGTGTDAGIISSGDSVVEGCRTDPPADIPDKKTYDAPPDLTIDTAKTYRATLDTSCGTIVIALDAKAAPTTVNNFVFLARERFYDGLTFHRVVQDFVVQGGDPQGDGTGDPGYEFEDELPTTANPYPVGAVAMANSGPDTNGSQFFIVTGDASFLEPNYTRFGRVVSGQDAAKRIESLADPADPNAQVPRQATFIFSVKIAEG